MGKNRALKQAIQIIKSDDDNNYSNDYICETILSMGTMGKAAIPFLLELLEGKYGDNECEALEALTQLKARDAIPYAIKILKDDEAYARSEAAIFLGALKVEQSVESLVNVLFDKRDDFLQSAAAQALGAGGFQQAIPDLLRLLNQYPEIIKDCDSTSSLACHVIETLGVLRAKKSTALLQQIVTHPQRHNALRKTALHAIIEIGIQKNDLDWLLPLLHDPQQPDSLRTQLPQPLLALSPEDTIPSLLQLIFDTTQSPPFREQIAKALRTFSIPKLLNTLNALPNPQTNRDPSLSWALDLWTPQGLHHWTTLLKEGLHEGRGLACEFLQEQKDNPLARDVMRCALLDNNEDLRRQVAAALDDIEDTTPLQISHMLRSTHSPQREAALTALSLPQEIVERYDFRVSEACKEWNDEQRITAAKDTLSDTEEEVRLATVTLLKKLPQHAVEPLLVTLAQDDSTPVRLAATIALGQRNTETSVSPLLLLLDDPESQVREWAAHGLGSNRSKKALPRLLQSLREDTSARVRDFCAKALEEIGDIVALPALCEALTDPNETVVEHSFKAITTLAAPLFRSTLWKPYSKKNIPHEDTPTARLGDEMCLTLMQAAILLLENEQAGFSVRRKSCRFLGHLGRKESVLFLQQRATQDDDTDVKKYALEALGDIGTTEALEFIIQQLTSEDYTAQETSLCILQQVGTPALTPSLLEILRRSSMEGRWLNLPSIKLLGQFGDSKVAASLLDYTELGWEEHTIAIATALGTIGSTQAIPKLTQLSKEMNGYNKTLVIRALGQIPSNNVIPTLQKALEDPNTNTQMEALLALSHRDPTTQLPSFSNRCLQQLEELPQNRWQLDLLIKLLTTLHNVPKAWRHQLENAPHDEAEKQRFASETLPWLSKMCRQMLERINAQGEHLAAMYAEPPLPKPVQTFANALTALKDEWIAVQQLYQQDEIDKTKRNWELALFQE